MKHIEINIGKSCNNKCRFCMSAFVWEDEKELTNFELIKKEIINYADKGYKSIWFLWWDISIHPKLYEIINEAKINWFKNIVVITNWMIFYDYQKAEKLILSWVNRVNISVHSHIEKIEDYLTQVKWWFEKKIKAIDNFNDLYAKWLLKSKISINIVLNKLNYKDVLKTCMYFYKVKNISDIRINFLWNRFFIWKKDKEDLELSYTQFLPYQKLLIIFSLKNNLRITFDSIPACIFYKLWFIDWKNIVKKFLWEDFDFIQEVANINKNQVFDWKEQKKDELKVKFKKCSECLYFDKCEWIWKEYVNSFWENEFIPVRE